MSAISPFIFESRQVRVLLDERGEPWFVAADVCAALGLANARDAVSRLKEREKGVANADTPGGRQQVTIISESAVYRLIFTSRVEGAERFKDWLSDQVLPSIRKTGAYIAPTQPRLPQGEKELRLALILAEEEKLKAWKELVAAEDARDALQAQVQQKELELAEVRPVAMLGHLMTPKGHLWTVTDAARALRVQRDLELFPLLRSRGWISKHGVTGLVPYTSATGGMGYVDCEPRGTRKRSSGREEPNIVWGLTEKGMRKLGEILGRKAEAEEEIASANNQVPENGDAS